MPRLPYQLALFTRGSGAYAYTYSGRAGLDPGQVAAVTFRGRIELGLVVGVDPQPPENLLPLWPVELHAAPHWGELLLELCAMTAAASDEVAGHALFGAPAAAVKLELRLGRPELLAAADLALLDGLAGALTPAKRALLARAQNWSCAVQAAAQEAVTLEASIAGTGPGARSHPRWRKWYAVDPSTLKLWGVPQPQPAQLPGSYLAGLAEAADFAAWPVQRAVRGLAAAPGPPPPAVPSRLAWAALAWPADWDIVARWQRVQQVPLRRCSASWAALRAPDGLLAELAGSIAAGENALLIAPQAWMLDRIWPMLAPCAARVMRYRPDGGASAAGHILRQLQTEPGQVVAGLPGAWKLAAFGNFHRVLLLDPSHPQYAPERYPGLDPRQALVLALSTLRGGTAQPPARLDMIDLGLSAWDGSGALAQVMLVDAFDPPADQPRPGGRADTNPLPLELRQPGLPAPGVLQPPGQQSRPALHGVPKRGRLSQLRFAAHPFQRGATQLCLPAVRLYGARAALRQLRPGDAGGATAGAGGGHAAPGRPAGAGRQPEPRLARRL